MTSRLQRRVREGGEREKGGEGEKGGGEHTVGVT